MTRFETDEISFDDFDEAIQPRPEHCGFDAVVETALSRRGLMGGVLAYGSFAALGSSLVGSVARATEQKGGGRFAFDAIATSTEDAVIVPAWKLPEGARGLQIETRLNGRTVQHSNTDALIFDVGTIIHDISRFTALRPGDLILTGTPAGVGVSRDPQLFLQPGDLCEVEIEGIGCLSNLIVSDETVQM